MTTPASSATPATDLVLPPLTDDEVSLLWAAVHLYGDVLDKVTAAVDALNPIRTAVNHDPNLRLHILRRIPSRGKDGMYRMPPLTESEGYLLLAALNNFADGLKNLAMYGDTTATQKATRSLHGKVRVAVLSSGEPRH